MNFRDTFEWVEWVEFFGQSDRGVTYVFVSPKPIARLRGESDILYIGETNREIRRRIKEETETNNTDTNTQYTNIRTTHVFRQLRQIGTSAKCYFVQRQSMHLSSKVALPFAEKLRTWDKSTYINRPDWSRPSIEKYLLVTYADEHLELPPLNNSF